MPNLSSLLHDEAADTLEDVLVPEGYWKGIIRAGKLYEKDAAGEALTDKNGDEYARAVLFIQCDEPVDGVDQTEVEAYHAANGPSETMARYNRFIRGRRDIRKIQDALAECGAITAGRSLDKILEGLNGADIPVQVLVVHEEYNDNIQANATELAAG